MISISLWVYASGVVLSDRGAQRYIVMTIWLAILNDLTWVAWLAGGDPRRDGVAIPEIIGAALLAIWVLVTVYRLSKPFKE